jgi:hypothetical protein
MAGRPASARGGMGGDGVGSRGDPVKQLLEGVFLRGLARFLVSVSLSRTVPYAVAACFVFPAKIWPTRVAKGISSAAYKLLARGLALSFRISTIIVA